jgi:adenosine deaminase
MINKKTRELIAQMPKAENHVHIEGYMTTGFILRLAKRNHVHLPFTTVPDGDRYIMDSVDSLDKFIIVFNQIVSVLQTEKDFEELVIEFAVDAKRQNILYRETMVSFPVHQQRGIPLEVMAKGLSEGRKVALREYGVEICYLVELDRALKSDSCLELIHSAKKYQDFMPAVGWELGLEIESNCYPAKEYIGSFELATELGFYKTAHAGEGDGPKNVWDVIRYLDVDRIDHGVRAVEDESLMEYLAQHNMFLTLCPTSNVACNIFPSLDKVPVRTFMEKGIPFSINTDDPQFFGDLISEFTRVADTFNLTQEEIISIARNAFSQSIYGQTHLHVFDSWVENWRKDQIS